MTEKLYEYAYDTECDALVVQCKKTEAGYEVLTDRTVIFPEGGGQLSDGGTMDGVRIISARDGSDGVWHLTDGPVSVGDKVHISLDTERRRDHSQQHLGEHIVSGLAHKLFGAKNVGFHMAEDHVTLDLDMFLDEPALADLEMAANRAVQANISVKLHKVTTEELAGLSLRKAAEGLSGDIRIVEVPGVDSCTCCGTHCRSTGEIGFIKLVDWAKYKGGVRIWLAAGERAVRDAQEKHAAVAALSKRFSVKSADVTEAVLRQGDELARIKHELKKRTAEYFGYLCAELAGRADEIRGKRLVLYRNDSLSAQELKLLGEKLTAQPGMIAILFSAGDDAVVYQLARSGDAAASMKELCQVINAAIGGKGGGKDEFAQGSAKRSAGLEESLEQLRDYFRKAL